MYILPLVSIPVMLQFPVALNLYWLTNNLISLVQARVFKLPAVRQKLGIGEIIAWKPEDLPMTSYYVSYSQLSLSFVVCVHFGKCCTQCIPLLSSFHLDRSRGVNGIFKEMDILSYSIVVVGLLFLVGEFVDGG